MDNDILRAALTDIRKDPVEAAKKLNGLFAIVVLDVLENKIVVIPSALGLCGVFIRLTGDGLVGVSTSLLALAAMGPVTLNDFTRQALYRCGHRLPPNTIFNEIRSVREGFLIEVERGGCQEHCFWAPNFETNHYKNISDGAETIAHHLTDYCTSLIEHGSSVFSDVTGGFDSRVSSACLIRAGIPFVPTVSGDPGHPDVLAAQRICASENLPLRATGLAEDPDTLSRDVENALLLSEGLIDSFTFAATVRAKQALFGSLDSRAGITVSGGLGESYRDFFWAQEFLDRGKHQALSIERLIRYRLDATSARMDFFTENWRESWKERLRDYVKEIVESYTGQRNTAQLDVVYLRKMAGMIGGFSTAAGRFSVPLLPFSSIPALNVALSVPPAWRYNSRLLRRIAVSLAPRFANHMTLSGCPCAPVDLYNWYRFLPRYILQSERLLRKVSTVWLGKTLFPEYTEPEPQHNPYAAFLAVQTRPGGRLHWPSMRTGNHYNSNALASLIQEARQPAGYRHRQIISRIYTCEAMVGMAELALSQPTTAALATRSERIGVNANH